MNKKTIIIVCTVLLIGVVVGGIAHAYLWATNDYKFSYDAGRPVNNALPRVAAMKAAVAAQTAFLVSGLDYGDRIWGVLDADSVVSAGGYQWQSIPLDSLRWVDPDLDSIACGVALGPTSLFLYDEQTD